MKNYSIKSLRSHGGAVFNIRLFDEDIWETIGVWSTTDSTLHDDVLALEDGEPMRNFDTKQEFIEFLETKIEQDNARL